VTWAREWGGAIAACQVWPEAEVVGIDIHQPSLELAETNVADAGLADRIELLHLDVRELPAGHFDLIWLPGPFLPSGIIQATLAATFNGLHPGGWVAFGLYGGPEDAESVAMADLRTLRSGGWPAQAQQVIDRLDSAGFVSTHQVPRTWQAPVRVVVGMRP
jgi:threonine dehydrogenase-like Zn-dependent dehydrogenase